MSITYIGTVVVDLPIRFHEGDHIDDDGAWALNEIMSTRIRERLRWRLRQGTATKETLQALALSMVDGFTFDTGEACDIDDPVMEEATLLARELIIASLAEDGLSPPKNLDEHARKLAAESDALRQRARQRIEARYTAAREAITNAENLAQRSGAA